MRSRTGWQLSREILEIALDELAKAHGAKELASAFDRVHAQVRANRRVAKKELGPLATAITEALKMRDRMKADGMSGDALNAGLEGVLRELWPKPAGRSEPWRYNCEACQDYGLEILPCPGNATCGFLKPHGPHEFGRPCFCGKGSRFRDAPKPTGTDAVERASKQKKPSRWGR